MSNSTDTEQVQPISYAEYLALAGDLNSRERFVAYSTVVRGEGGFDFKIIPNSDLVVMGDEATELENAMAIGNWSDRQWRALEFAKDRILRPSKPVLVSEGDSWFQFPVIIRDIVDHLSDEYAILSLGAAGDTAENMVDGPLEPGGSEYLTQLRAQAKHVKAFLFSAAGNDIIGEDPKTKHSALFGILNPFNGDLDDVEGHINEGELGKRIGTLSDRYIKVVDAIRGVSGLEKLPIVFHGYDYCFPYPWGPDDPRNPRYAKNDEWLGEPFEKRKFPASSVQELELRRKIIIVLIDRLYDMLNSIAANAREGGIWVVNCREAMPNIADWNDEIHGTSAGFKKIADRFKETLTDALVGV